MRYGYTDCHAAVLITSCIVYKKWLLGECGRLTCVQMYYGGAEDELSTGTDSMRYTGSAVPPRLSSRPGQPATDCLPSYAGTLTPPTCCPDPVLRGEGSRLHLTAANLPRVCQLPVCNGGFIEGNVIYTWCQRLSQVHHHIREPESVTGNRLVTFQHCCHRATLRCNC